jgi:hypothetical protein
MGNQWPEFDLIDLNGQMLAKVYASDWAPRNEWKLRRGLSYKSNSE